MASHPHPPVVPEPSDQGGRLAASSIATHQPIISAQN